MTQITKKKNIENIEKLDDVIMSKDIQHCQIVSNKLLMINFISIIEIELLMIHH